jgi:CRISPR/Cas system-associated exonuclease Cas4 (RecB family)
MQYKMSKIYINQSLIKDLAKYQNDEECGLVLYNKWIFKQLGEGTKANKLGHFFEYLCTGALAKEEIKKPQSDYNKKGELSSDFELARKQSVFFQELINKYGIKLLSASDKVLVDDKWIGTLDIVAQWESISNYIDFEFGEDNPEKKVIIDLKFSGWLDDKWSEYGWHTDTLPKKQGTMLQAKHYKFLFWKKYGFNPPFLFFVFDAKVVGRAKIINVDIDEWELEQHEVFLEKAKKYFEHQQEIGFKPKPNYERCLNCQYSNWCDSKITKPPVITIKPE